MAEIHAVDLAFCPWLLSQKIHIDKIGLNDTLMLRRVNGELERCWMRRLLGRPWLGCGWTVS